jgi:hypothetical protein
LNTSTSTCIHSNGTIIEDESNVSSHVDNEEFDDGNDRTETSISDETGQQENIMAADTNCKCQIS